MKLTEKLDALLKENNMNKAQLSAQCGIPYTTIVSLYEKGYDNAKRSTLLRIARFFEVSLDFLADDDVEERTQRVTSGAAQFEVKYEPATSSRELADIDNELATLLRQLTPEQAQRAIDFVRGLLASR